MSRGRVALLLAVALVAVGWWIVHANRDDGRDPAGLDRPEDPLAAPPLAGAGGQREAAHLKGRPGSAREPEPQEQVRVLVTDEAGIAVPRATLRVYPRGDEDRLLLAVDVVNGAASFQVPPDTELVHLRVLEPRGFDGRPLDLAGTTRRNVLACDRCVRITLPRGRNLSGRVLRDDGKPGAGLVVLAAYPGDGTDTPSCTTDARGAFTLHSVPRSLARIRLQDGQGWGAHGTGLVRPDEDGIEIVVSRVGDFEILVLDPEGAPLPGAAVQVVDDVTNHTLEGRTAQDGRFVAKGCAIGAGCTIDVDATGCRPSYPRTSVEVPAPRPDRRTVRVPPAVWLRGSVLEPGGEPVPGVSVTADAVGGRQSAHIARTDADGRFELRPLPPGRYEIQVWLMPVLAWLPPPKQTVDVPGPPVELRLVQPIVVRGRILGADPAWTQVTWHGGDGFVEFVPIDPDGSFEISHARAGLGLLKVGDTESCGLYFADLDTRDAPFEIDCRTYKDIRGKVRDLRPEPSKGLRLGVTVHERLAPVHLDADGTFRTPRLPPGTYTLEAWDDVGSFEPVTAQAGDRDVVFTPER